MPSNICKEIKHNFQVFQLDSFKIDQQYAGDKTSVTHNGTRIWFQLCITPADSKHKFSNRMGVYLKYVDGPQESMSIRFSSYVMRGGEKRFLSGTWWVTVARGDFCGNSAASRTNVYYQLPRRRSDLESKGYINQDDTILIRASVCISLDAFEESSTLDCAAPSVSGCSEYICRELNPNVETKITPSPIPEVTEEEQLAIAIQESEEEEKERQRQLDLFLKFNGPDFGGGQCLSDTELIENLKDGLVTRESTNTPSTPTRDQKLYPSLVMKEQQQEDMAGSGALSTPVDAQQTLESPLNNGAQTNDQFALGLRELNGLVMGGCSDLVSLQKQILEQQNLMHARMRLLELQMLEQRRMLAQQRFQHQQQIQYGQGQMSNFGVWPQSGLGMHESQRTPSYNPSHTISQQPMIMQQYSNSHYAYPSLQYQHQQIQYGQVPMSNLSVWPQPQYGFGTLGYTPYPSSIQQPIQQQWTNNYNPNQTFIQQPIQQQYSNSQHAYPSPHYLNATAPPQMCPQMPGADQQGNNTNQPNVGLLIDL